MLRPNRRLRWVAIPVVIGLSVLVSGCSQQQLQGWLPTEPGTTNHVDRIMGLWVTSWIVLLAVGVATWGLIIWAAIVYRRRKGQTGLPVQLRYNLPIEIFYTVVPLILVLGFFAFTARDQYAIENPIENPDVVIDVYGKRWSWDFNYVKEDVYSSGIQAQPIPGEGILSGGDSLELPDLLNDVLAGGEMREDLLPVLYLPVGRTVQINIESRDVAHSFWVVEFLYKKDMFPGKTNSLYFVPEKTGTFAGKCAELCGEYHALMLFQVKVVPQDEYDSYIESQRAAGFEGQLDERFDTNQNLPGNGGRDEEGE